MYLFYTNIVNNRIVNIEQIDGRVYILGHPERCYGTYIIRDYDVNGNEYSTVERNYRLFVDKAEMNISGQSESMENENIIYRYDYSSTSLFKNNNIGSVTIYERMVIYLKLHI